MFAIPNCDTVKKARNFLENNKIDYEFIDFKKSPPTKAQIKAWSDYSGELPINKKGMTYRKYKDYYEALSMPEKIRLDYRKYSLIKRPVLVYNGKTIALGFNEEQYKELNNKMHLILFVDINGAVILDDVHRDKNFDLAIQQLITENNIPIGEAFQKKFTEIKRRLTESELFSSFIHLIKYLKYTENGIHYNL